MRVFAGRRSRRTSTLRRAVTGVLLAALAAGTLAAAADPTCAIGEPSEANWGSNRPVSPNRDSRTLNFINSADEIYLGFGVGQRQGTTAAVVDSSTLQVSSDAGCTWESRYAFDRAVDPTGEIEPSTSRFAAVAVSDRASGPERIVALVFDLESGVSARVRTLVSDDGGATFAVGGVGLPNALVLPWSAGQGCGPGRGCLLAMAPNDPDRVYVLLEGISSSLYVSHDGGRTFRTAASSGIIGEGGRASPSDIAVSRTNPNVLWGGEAFGTVVTSTNSGGSWSSHDLAPAIGSRVRGVLAVAVLEDDIDEVVAIVTDDDGEQWVAYTEDKGLRWDAAPSNLGETVVDLEAGFTNGQFIATTEDGGAHALNVANLSWSRLGGASLGPLADIHPLEGGTTVWFRGPSNLPVTGNVKFQPPDIFDDLRFGILPFDPLNPVGRLPGTLTVPREVIALDVGQSTQVEAVLHLPKTPTPLDIFFMFDESGSMAEEMAALAQGMAEITRELGRRDVYPNVGLGGYGGGWRYLLRRDIGPPDAEFQRELERLGTGGCGSSGFETAYTALHQMALGTGLPDSRGGCGPEPGWNAHWRSGAVRVAINLTDERLQPEEFPTVDDTLTALIEQRVKVIGLVSGDRVEFSEEQPLSVDGGIRENDGTFGPVAVMARKTEALAPAGGVDCGADGEIDIAPGGPLACYLSPLVLAPPGADVADLLPDLADVMVEILESVTENHTITFYRQFPDVITDIQPLVPTLVDIRDPQTIPARLTITCPREREGQILRPLISAAASSRVLAANQITIACGPITREALASLGSLAPLAAAAAAPAPPPPPVPVTAAAQASAGAQAAAAAQAPAAATSVIPQVGVAAVVQQEQQSQVATIGGVQPSARDQDALAFEFAGRRQPDQSPATLVLGAAMTLGAAGLARRRRTVEASSPARIRLGR